MAIGLQIKTDAGDLDLFKDEEKNFYITRQIFDINNQPDFTPILCQLNFASGKKITKKGGWIGTQIQRPRPLSEADVTRLNKYARTLKLE